MAVENHVELSKIEFKGVGPLEQVQLHRLASALDTRWHISRGDYPMRYFSSEPEADGIVPIYPETYKGKYYGGLERGLYRAIFSLRESCIELGLGVRADHLIAYDKARK